MPVLGVLPRDAGIEAPSRHLGLVPAAERADAAAALDRLADQIADATSTSTRCWRSRTPRPALAAEPVGPGRARSDASGGRAGRWSRWPAGARSPSGTPRRPSCCAAAGLRAGRSFDPLTDDALPAGTRRALPRRRLPRGARGRAGRQRGLRARDRARPIAAGMPTVAECAGLLYLCRTVDGAPMVGAIDADAAMTPRLTLAYRTARSPTRPAARRAPGPGDRRTSSTAPRSRRPHGERPALAARGRDGRPIGLGRAPTLHASYLHTHWAGHPRLAAAVRRRGARVRGRQSRPPGAPRTDARRRCRPDPRTAPWPRCATTATPSRPRPGRPRGQRTDPAPAGWLGRALARRVADLRRLPRAADGRGAIAAAHGRRRAGAGDGRRRRGLHPGRPGPAVAAPGRRAPPVHRARGRAARRRATDRDRVVLTADDGFALDPAPCPTTPTWS